MIEIIRGTRSVCALRLVQHRDRPERAKLVSYGFLSTVSRARSSQPVDGPGRSYLIEPLLSDFARKDWDSKPFERLVDLVVEAPADAEAFASGALQRIPEGGTFLDLSLSFVSPEGLARLISQALPLLRREPRDAAESVIAYSGLQYPSLLHPFLHELFTLRPNVRTYYENWPWRESPASSYPPLFEIIESSSVSSDRMKAWRCLLESRDSVALAHAIASAASVPLEHTVRAYLEDVGFEGPDQPLYDFDPIHMIFPDSYFAPRPAWIGTSFHPTWRLEGALSTHRFGGLLETKCGLCAGALHHLITLPALPPIRPLLELATCLSCLGWEQPVLWYHHDVSGAPNSLDHGSVTPQFPAEPLRETSVRLVKTPPRWRWQAWGMSNSRENLSRLGGHPAWVQSAEYPPCPSCGNTARFLLQLDSDLPSSDGDEWLWGSGGVCYGFHCSPCCNTAFLWQCT